MFTVLWFTLCVGYPDYHLHGQNYSQLGIDIDGEAADDESSYSVSLSSDGNVVAIGATGNDGTGPEAGHFYHSVKKMDCC